MKLTKPTSRFLLAFVSLVHVAVAGDPDRPPALVHSLETAVQDAPVPVSASEAPQAASVTPTPEKKEKPASASTPCVPSKVGEAGPPSASGTSCREGGEDAAIRIGAEVFGQYGARWNANASGTSFFHQFDLPRAHASLEGHVVADKASASTVGARVLLEATRSASEGALLGVAGNSLVLRLREAYATYKFRERDTERRPSGEARIGIIPMAVVGEIDGTFLSRAAGPGAIELSGVLPAADLGVSLRLRNFNGVGHSWIQIAATNGDGYTQLEFNRGKNVELSASVHPWTGVGVPELSIFVAGSLGSVGPASVRAHRATAGVLWQSQNLRTGVIGTFAYGFGGDGTVKSIVSEAFVRIDPIPELFFLARGQLWLRTLDGADTVVVATVGGGWKPHPQFEALLALERSIPSSQAAAALPQTDYWEVRPVARAYF